jgi:hypothetical protein
MVIPAFHTTLFDSRSKRQDPVDDMVRPSLVGGVEVPRLGRRLERAHHHPRRIGAQIESLPVQKSANGLNV